MNTTQNTVRSTKRRSIGIGLAALALPALLGFAGSTAASAAPGDLIEGPVTSTSVGCLPADVLVNSGLTAPFSLQRYGVDDAGGLSLVSDIELDQIFGDIALTTDNQTLYGTNFSIPMYLSTIDQETGVSTQGPALTLPDGTPVSNAQGLNALSATMDGRLYIAGSQTSSIWYADTSTGVLTEAPFSFPVTAAGVQLTAGGDFLHLDANTLISLATANFEKGYLVTFDLTTNEANIVGEVPTVYGAAQSGNTLYLATAAGSIVSIDDIPTAASEAMIPYTEQVDTGLSLYGATSNQDAIACQSGAMTFQKALSSNADEDGTGTVTPGDTLSYTLTSTNTGEAALTNVVVTDTLTGDTVTCDVVAPGDTCVLNVEYVATNADAAVGEIVSTGTVSSNELDPLDSDVTVPVSYAQPAMSIVKVLSGNADEDGSGTVTEGDTLSYTLTASNDGNTFLTNVAVSDSLTGEKITCDIVPLEGRCVLDTTYVVTADDANTGEILNIGVATSDQTEPAEGSVTVPVETVTPPTTPNNLSTGNNSPSQELALTGFSGISAMLLSAIMLVVLGSGGVVLARRSKFS